MEEPPITHPAFLAGVSATVAAFALLLRALRNGRHESASVRDGARTLALVEEQGRHLAETVRVLREQQEAWLADRATLGVMSQTLERVAASLDRTAALLATLARDVEHARTRIEQIHTRIVQEDT